MSEIVRMVVILSLISGFSAAALTVANVKLGPQIERQTDLYVRGPGLERLSANLLKRCWETRLFSR